MTNLIRQKHRFLYHGLEFYAKDLTLEQFLMINLDPDEWYKQIMLECNDTLPSLNDRQKKEFVRILMWWKQEDTPNLIDQLTETEKKIKAQKEKKKREKVEQEIDDFLRDWHIIEWQMMHVFHQSLAEMRSWPYKYFMELYKDMGICTGAKEYDKDRNSTEPDKKAIKKEFGDLYNK